MSIPRKPLISCECCKVFIATCHGHDERGVFVRLCHTCFMKIDSRLTLHHRQAKLRAALEVEQLEDMWKRDGSWIKEGAVMR